MVLDRKFEIEGHLGTFHQIKKKYKLKQTQCILGD